MRSWIYGAVVVCLMLLHMEYRLIKKQRAYEAFLMRQASLMGKDVAVVRREQEEANKLTPWVMR